MRIKKIKSVEIFWMNNIFFKSKKLAYPSLPMFSHTCVLSFCFVRIYDKRCSIMSETAKDSQIKKRKIRIICNT